MSENINKQTQVVIRCSADEKAQMKKNSGNIPVSTFLRDLGLRKRNVTGRIELSDDAKKFKSDIERLGNNLNQTLRHLHAAENSGDVESEMYQKLIGTIALLSQQLSTMRELNRNGVTELKSEPS